jgi:hypothetical protein
MTVTATANKYRYQGNGVTDTFAFPARVYSVDDLVIEIITRSTDALEETLVLTTDYTVTIASNGTASVQVTNGAKIPDNTQDILIYRELENEQTLSLPTGTVFPAKSVETQLDRAVSQIQDLKEIVDRSIKIPVQSSLLSLEIESLPEAGKSLKWNATEDGLINSDFDPDEQAATATAQAVIATTQAGIATTAANNAAADAIATAADRVQTGLDAAAAAQSALAAQVAKMEWQGAWSAGTYQINDVVGHIGSSWIATAVTTEEPSISATDWDLVALKGSDGVGLTDGDKGDITVSSSGTVWTIDNNAVTSAKIADSNVTTGKIADLNVTAGKIGSGAATNGQALLADGSGGAAWGSAAGKLVQRAYASNNTYTTDTVGIPLDNTLPQNTEGTEFLSQAFTPTSASNIIRITVTAHLAHSTGVRRVVAALFQSGSANAVGVGVCSPSTSNYVYTVAYTVELSAGSTSARTYSARFGADSSGTSYLNGQGGARVYGGAMVSSMVIEEIIP